MAAGREIKRLRGKVSAADAARLIGVGVDRLRKWEERDADPSDSGDIKRVEAYFGCSLTELKDLKSFDFVEVSRDTEDYQKKYIRLLEKNLADLEERNRQIMVSLADLRRGQNSQTAMMRVMQEFLYPLIAEKKKQKPEDIRKVASNTALLYFQELEKTGS